MNNDNTSGNRSPGGFQFDESMMELLRRGDEKARNAVAGEIIRYFDALVRRIRAKTGYALGWHECEDAVQDFIGKFFGGKLARYEDKNAEEFSRIFVSSLDNHARDWYDKVVKTSFGPGSQNLVSTEKPMGRGDDGSVRTLGDTLEDKDSPKERLLPSEYAELVEDLKAAMLRHADGDEMKAWVIEANLAKGMKAEEISAAVPVLFPGKVFAAGSVYSIVSRFREGPELAAVSKKWMAGEAWIRMR